MLCRTIGIVPALVCVSAVLLGHSCLGQTAPPATSAPASGPVVVGEKQDRPVVTQPAATTQPAIPALDVPPHPDPKDFTGPSAPSSVKPPVHSAAKDVSATFACGSRPYVIGSLDVIEIQVWNSPNLSGIRDVGSDGLISMPLIGEIRADGLTKEQLTAAIKEKLAASVFADPPEVTVQVLRGNSKKYYVFGEVNRSGEFPLIGCMTVLDAFANTGGFHEFAKTKAIYILRGDQTIKFNFKDVSHGKNMQQNIQLENGDRIFVP